MTREEAIEALGTIAHSGTKEFLKQLQSRDVKDNPELIGQFGVGFYSAFMVADKVTVVSRKPVRRRPGVRWESEADGTFTVEDVEKEGSGTDVILHLKEDEKQYLDEWELREVVKQYSDFIEHPVVMEVTRSQPDPGQGEADRDDGRRDPQLAEGDLAQDKIEITEEEYNEFYKHVSHDFADPAKVIHYKAEGPRSSPPCSTSRTAPLQHLLQRLQDRTDALRNRVQIMDHCEAMLSFMLRPWAR